jgi:hypothetical protein
MNAHDFVGGLFSFLKYDINWVKKNSSTKS